MWLLSFHFSSATWNWTITDLLKYFPTHTISCCLVVCLYQISGSFWRWPVALPIRWKVMESRGESGWPSICLCLPWQLQPCWPVPVSVPYTLWCLQGSAQRLWLAEFRMVSKIMLGIFIHKFAHICTNTKLCKKNACYFNLRSIILLISSLCTMCHY